MDSLLYDVVDLFGQTLGAVSGVPVLRFFLVLPLFFAVLELWAGIQRSLKGGTA